MLIASIPVSENSATSGQISTPGKIDYSRNQQQQSQKSKASVRKVPVEIEEIKIRDSGSTIGTEQGILKQGRADGLWLSL